MKYYPKGRGLVVRATARGDTVSTCAGSESVLDKFCKILYMLHVDLHHQLADTRGLNNSGRV